MTGTVLLLTHHERMAEHLREIEFQLSEIAGILTGELGADLVEVLPDAQPLARDLKVVRTALEMILLQGYPSLPDWYRRQVYDARQPAPQK